MKRKSLAVNGAFSLLAKVITMIVPLCVYPYVMRVLGAENYGKVAYVESFIGYFSLLAALGIDNYAQRECSVLRNDKVLMTKKASQIYVIGFIMSIISFIIYIGCLILVPQMHSEYILYLIFSVMIFSSCISVNWLYAAQERFDLTSIREIISKLAYLIFCYLLIKSSNDYIIYGAIVVVTTSLITMIWNQVCIHRGECDIIPNFKESKGFSVCFKPIFYMALLTVGSKLFTDSDVIMIKWFIEGNGDKAVGLYNSAILLPKAFDTLLMAVSAVITPQLFIAVKNGNEETVVNLMNKTTNVLFFISIPAIVTCLFFSKEMLYLFSGEEYLPAASVLQIYSIIILGVLVITMAGTRTYIARQKEKKLFQILFFAAALNICLNIIFIKLWGINGAAFATLVSYIITLIIELTLEHTWHYAFSIDKIKYLIGGFALALIFGSIKLFTNMNAILTISIALMIGGLVYVLVLSLMKETAINLIIDKIKNRAK